MFGNLINKALSSASKLGAIAKNMIEKDVQIYDASTHSITIAGLEMRGWETASISDLEITKEIVGMESNEVAIIRQLPLRKLSMSFLPTEPSYLKLESLAALCMSWGKYFTITIIENGSWVGDYKAQFSSVGGRRMAQEGENPTVEFHLVPISTRAVEELRISDKPTTDSIEDLINETT